MKLWRKKREHKRKISEAVILVDVGIASGKSSVSAAWDAAMRLDVDPREVLDNWRDHHECYNPRYHTIKI